MSFKSFLQTIGADFKKIFESPITQEVESVAAMTGSVLFPALGPLFNSTAQAVILAEQNAAALGKQSGSGPQKLASVLAFMEPVISAALADAGKANDTAAVTNYINSVVNVLNNLPAPTTSTGG